MADPITEELALDLSQALRDLGTLEDAIEQMAQGFRNSLAEAVGVLSEVVVPDVEVDQVRDELSAALTAAATPVTVAADASEVTTSIDEAIAAASVEPVAVEADTSAVEEALANIEDTTVTVTVEADTEAAASGQQSLQEEFEQTGAAAEGAASGIDRASLAATTLGSVATIGQGRVAGLSGATSLLGDSAGQVAGALGLVVGAGAAFAQQSLEAEAATRRFNEELGIFADSVERIDIGNLDTELSALALALGTDDDALRNTAASIVQMADAADIGTEAAAEQAEAVIALASAAVAANPALGDVAAVADSMTLALARGGRFAAEFNIALTPVEIRAKAAENALRGLGDGVSVQALSLAGAQLAIEKYGNTLDEKIGRGLDSAIIQQRSLTATVSEAIEEFGKPLRAPFLELLEAGTPVVIQFADVIATVAEEGLPALTALLELLGFVLTALGPVIDLLGLIPDPITAATVAFVALTAAIRTMIGILPAAAAGFIPFVANIGAALVVIGSVAAAILSIGGAAEETTPALPGLAQELVAVRTAAEGTTTEIVDLTASITELLETSRLGSLGDELLADDLLGRLRDVGFGLDDLASAFSRGDEGAAAFASAVVESLSPADLEALQRFLAQTGATAEELIAVLVAGGNPAVEFGARLRAIGESVAPLPPILAGLIGDFQAQQLALQESARSELVLRAENDLLTESEERLLQKLRSSGDPLADYNGLLVDVENRTNGVTEATDETARSMSEMDEVARLLNLLFGSLSGSLVEQNDAWVALALSIASGTTTVDEYAQAAVRLGASTADVEAFGAAVAISINNFVDTATSRLPEASAAFEDLNDDAKVTAEEIATQFETIASQSFVFVATIARLQKGGFSNLAAAIAEQGPAAAAAIAELFASAPEQIPILDELAKGARTSLENARTALDDIAPDIVFQSGQLARDLEAEFQVDFESATLGGLNRALAALQSFKVPDESRIGREIGISIGDSVIDGLAFRLGISKLEASGFFAAQQVSGPPAPVTLAPDVAAPNRVPRNEQGGGVVVNGPLIGTIEHPVDPLHLANEIDRQVRR